MKDCEEQKSEREGDGREGEKEGKEREGASGNQGEEEKICFGLR